MSVTSFARSICVGGALFLCVAINSSLGGIYTLTPNADTYVYNSSTAGHDLDGVYATGGGSWAVGVWQYDLSGITEEIIGAKLEYFQVATAGSFTANVYMYTGALGPISEATYGRTEYDTYAAAGYTDVTIGDLNGAFSLGANNPNDVWYSSQPATLADVALLEARRTGANQFALFFMDDVANGTSRVFDDKEDLAIYTPGEGTNGIRLTITTIPEPSAITLLTIGLIGGSRCLRRRT